MHSHLSGISKSSEICLEFVCMCVCVCDLFREWRTGVISLIATSVNRKFSTLITVETGC